MRRLHVTDIDRRMIHGKQELRAEFVLGRRRMPVWLRTDCGPISEMGDPFVPVALIPAMRRNWGLRIDAPVSSDLLAGTGSIQVLMTGWYTKFHRVSVEVRTEVRQRATEPGRTATFFSGGVDSFFTLRQHLDQIDTFGAPLDLRALRYYPPVTKYERDRFEEALALLQRRDANPNLQAVLREMLAANGQLPLRGRLSRTIARARTYLSHRLP